MRDQEATVAQGQPWGGGRKGGREGRGGEGRAGVTFCNGLCHHSTKANKNIKVPDARDRQ